MDILEILQLEEIRRQRLGEDKNVKLMLIKKAEQKLEDWERGELQKELKAMKRKTSSM